MALENIVQYADLVRDQPEDKWGRSFFCNSRTGRMCKMGYAFFVKKGVSIERFYNPEKEDEDIYQEALNALGLNNDEAKLLLRLNDTASSAAEAQQYIDQLAAGEDFEELLREEGL
jgi:putative heme degradation protein